MITKVISGGQIGADLAGLRAATLAGIETGGWVPKGWKTLAGPNPGLGAAYGLKEHSSSSYAERTKQNVLDSDGTVRFAVDFNSRGEKCTLRNILFFNKPSFDVPLFPSRTQSFTEQLNQFQKWLDLEDIDVLNVAGNARRDIEMNVEWFLVESSRRMMVDGFV